MDYEFNSKEELYKRVLPALHVRENELKRLGYLNIKCLDIWNCLIEIKWKYGKNLMLSDIVSDILSIQSDEIISYLDKVHNY